MAFYDIFYLNKHSSFFEGLLTRFSANILDFLLKGKTGNISILEIGPGKGYFYRACQRYNSQIEYWAMDRNPLILKSLGIKNSILVEAPNFPLIDRKFDIIYISYVAEHLNSGREVYELLEKSKGLLKKDGSVVLFVPDAMKQKMEFWNIDYTHLYPTTKRNMTMVLNEAGFNNVQIYEINGLITHRYFANRIVYRISRVLLFFYNYKIFSFFLSLVSSRSTLNDPFYRAWCLIKEENLMIVAK